MPRSTVIKYVAAGFRCDSEKLLNEFVDQHSFEFSEFSKIWKKNNFSFIFMGRENDNELKEFTEECFRITVERFSSNTAFLLKVGAIYLLYGLYIKQPLSPKVKIRIQISEIIKVQSVLDKASENGYKSLCFVIHSLYCQSAFCYIALPKLMGPLVNTSEETESERTATELHDMKNSSEEFLCSGYLDTLSQVHERYVQARLSIAPSNGHNLDVLLENKYDDAIREFSTLLKDEEYVVKEKCQSSITVDETKGIGSRRAQLKEAQFFKKADHYRSKSQSDSHFEDDISDPEANFDNFFQRPKKGKLVTKKKKNQRGRPRKNPIVEESESSESDIFDKQLFAKDEDNQLKNQNLNRAIRKRHHYEEEFKRKQP